MVTVPPSKRSNPARKEYVDVVTGVRRPPGAPGSKPSGRLVMRLRPAKGAPLETVEVDPEDLDPARDTFGVDRDARPSYVASAKRAAKTRKKREREAQARRRRLEKRQLKGERATFRSAREGARELFEANRNFYGPIVESADPIDFLDRWFDTNEIKVGKRYRSLRDTKRGRELEDMHRDFGPEAVVSALAYVLGKARGKRWDNVDWDTIRDYNHALMEAYGGPIQARFELPAVALGLPPEQEAILQPPAIQEQYRWIEAQAELWGAAEAMDAAYKQVRKHLSKDERKVIRARIRDVQAWAEDPATAPDWACVSDAVYCDYPVAWAEVDQILLAPEQGYDPAWPLREIPVEAEPLEDIPWEGTSEEDLDLPWENPPTTIKVSPTFLSVMETEVDELATHPEWHGLSPEESFAYQALANSIHGNRLVLPDDPLAREAIWSLLVDLSNTFDDAAEYGLSEDKAFDRRAARTLSAVSMKIHLG